MRVLVITNMYPSEAKPTYGVFVRDQVEDLQELGLDMEVLSFPGYEGGLNYVRAAVALRSRLSAGEFDLIHAHYGLSGALALGRRRREPLVTTFHGSDTYIWWHRVISWVVARLATPIFVSADRARALRLPAAVVIPSGVDTAVFTPVPPAVARRTLGWDDAAAYVLFPGARGETVKGFALFEQVIEAAREVIPDLETACLEDFDRRDIPLVMNAVDATLMTSDREGSPVAVRESLSCLTPVVSVPVGDVPEVLVRLPGCSIGSREPSDLARRLLEAVRSGKQPALRDRAELYSRQRIAKQILAVYEDVLRRRGRIA